MSDIFNIKCHVYGTLKDEELPTILVEMAREILRREDRAIVMMRDIVWSFLQDRVGKEHFTDRFSAARGWIGGQKQNNYGLHLFVPGKFNLMLCCVRWGTSGDSLRSLAMVRVAKLLNHAEDAAKLDLPTNMFSEIENIISYYSSL